MKAVVVYESHWGNTEAIAQAVAAGFGPGADALTTDEASGALLIDVGVGWQPRPSRVGPRKLRVAAELC